MTKLLITYGTRPLAHRLANLLQGKYEIVFGSSEEIPGLLLNTNKYFQIPTGVNSTYAHEILKVCLDQGVEKVLPLGPMELAPLAEAKVLFEEYGIHILVPSLAVLEDISIIENPPASLPLVMVDNGELVLGTVEHQDALSKIEGLMLASDSGDEWALCCVNG